MFLVDALLTDLSYPLLTTQTGYCDLTLLYVYVLVLSRVYFTLKLEQHKVKLMTPVLPDF